MGMELPFRKRSIFAWLVIVLVLAPFLLYNFPFLIGASNSYIVLSGSMEPAIPTGSVVFVHPVEPENIYRDDVVTFRKGSSEDTTLTTHRVVSAREVDGTYEFQTKGDANEDPDPAWITGDQIVGEVSFSIPYMGYALEWAGSTQGFLAFVVLPAILIILGELHTIWRETRGSEEEEMEEESGKEFEYSFGT